MTQLKKLKTVNFQEYVCSGGVVLVDFYSDTCSPCKMLEPQLEQLNQEFDNVQVYKVNAFDETELTQEYAIMSVPTLLLFQDGELTDKLEGFRPYEALVDWIKLYM